VKTSTGAQACKKHLELRLFSELKIAESFLASLSQGAIILIDV